jgi:hypothetical protein
MYPVINSRIILKNNFVCGSSEFFLSLSLSLSLKRRKQRLLKNSVFLVYTNKAYNVNAVPPALSGINKIIEKISVGNNQSETSAKCDYYFNAAMRSQENTS